MNMVTFSTDASNVTPVAITDYPPDSIILTEEVEQELLNYCMGRMNASRTARMARIRRYAGIDRNISTHQTLSFADSVRARREDATGAPQAIAASLPIADAHVKDTTAFFTEIFAPASGNFYSNQGDANLVGQVTDLAKDLDADMKTSGYYDEIVSGFRSLLKYNAGGFELHWSSGNAKGVGVDRLQGNRINALDMYNFFYDTAIRDLGKLRSEGEWYATVAQKSRMWLLRQIEAGYINKGNRIIDNIPDSTTTNFYVIPPVQAGIPKDGKDARQSSNGSSTSGEPDWDSYGLGTDAYTTEGFVGHEIVTMHIWLNPNQLGLADKKVDSLGVYKVLIVDGETIAHLEAMPEAVELPIYADYADRDEMLDSFKSLGEAMHLFQRQISFYMNATTAAERGNTWHLRLFNPDLVSKEDLQAGETSGWVALKKPVADVRMAVMDLNQTADTQRNWNSIQAIMGLQQSLYPTSQMPNQIAGLDRAVNSQVAAVLQGSTRRIAMQVRSLDSSIMAPLRMASFRNYVAFSEKKSSYSELTETDVGNLLNSGLGQLNREVAAGAIERLLFSLIQNPDSAAQFDMPQLFRVWSQMLNTGTDLGKLVSAQGAAGQQGAIPVPPAAPGTEGQPVAAGTQGLV